MTVLSDYQNLIVSDAPSRYWPLTETSGTTATDLIASEVATCVGMTMGGGDGPDGRMPGVGGLGGKAPVFDGTNHILLRSNKILGGQSAWTVEAWVRTTALNNTEKVFYGEMSTTAGSNMVRAGFTGLTSGPQLRHTYGSDVSVVSQNSGSVFVYTLWTLVHFQWQTGGNIEAWWNAGKRLTGSGSSSSATWTNANVAAWLGAPPRSGNGNPFTGQVAHVALYNKLLTPAEKIEHYHAGTPLQRPLLDLNPLWTPTGPWNQALDDPLNEPDIAANSATMVQKLANQVTTYGVGVGLSGPTYIVDDAHATQRVRMQGGQNNNSTDKPALYNAFGVVPVPANAASSSGGDATATVVNIDTNELWEFWQLNKTLVAPEFVACVLESGGSIPVNATSYAYVVYPSDGTGAIGIGKSAAAFVTTAGTQKVRLGWGTSEGATTYRIYRRLNTFGSSGGLFMAEVNASVHTWTDDGSVTPGASSTAAAVVVTADWGASYGGYLIDITENPGYFEAPRANWGTTATSLPLIAGTIMLKELYDDVEIEHALCMDLYETTDSHVFPAQRHDFWFGSNAIPEGMRFQLDPAIDVTTITSIPFTRKVMRALQKYGMIARDHAGAISGCFVEGAEVLGRDPYPELYNGFQSYEVLNSIPWSQMRVIDSAWTLAESSPTPPVVLKIGTIVDDFEDGVIDTAKWSVTGSPAPNEIGGGLHIPMHSSPYSRLTTAGGPYSLRGSSLFWKTSQRSVSDPADQTGISVVSDVDAVNCKINLWIESPAGVVGTGVGGGGLKLQYYQPTQTGVTVSAVAFDPSAHAFQRIRENNGVIFAEASPDGVSWTELGHFDWSATGWNITALDSMNAILFAGNFNGVGGADMIIDSFNAIEVPAVLRINLPVQLSVGPRVTELVIDG